MSNNSLTQYVLENLEAIQECILTAAAEQGETAYNVVPDFRSDGSVNVDFCLTGTYEPYTASLVFNPSDSFTLDVLISEVKTGTKSACYGKNHTS